jgi:predicted permease
MDTLRQDLRYALRLWARRPGFAIVAMLTLAIGVGANTAMFSIVNAVLLRPLPFAHGDRVATIWGRTPTNRQALISWDEYVECRQQSTSFDAVGLWLGQSVNLTGTNEPQRILGNFVTGSFFEVLELRAERGRLFSEAESAPSTVKPIVVVSHNFWQRQLDSDPQVIGRVITLNGLPLTIIGVLETPFDTREVPANGWFINYDAFIPIALFPVPGGIEKAGPGVLGIARLRADASIATANANLDVLSRRMETANPRAQAGRSTYAMPAHDTLVGESRTPLLLLLAAVGVVLLIACVNVSNLLIARAVDRQKEIAVRSALGARPSTVLRQLAVEAALLAITSSLLGLFLGRSSLDAVRWLKPPNVPIPDRILLDARVLLFTIAIGAAVAIVCALAPAGRIVRSDLNRVLQSSGRRTTGGSRFTRDALVVAEIALSVTLVAMSGLLIQSMLSLQRVKVGFDGSNVLTLQFRLPATKYATPDAIARFFRTAIAQVRAVPGVESAALVRRVPFSGNWGDTPFVVEGRPAAAGSEPRAGQNMITPDYFRAMRIPLVRGRDFSERDDGQSLPVVIVNETFARTMWPGEDAVGKRVKVPDFKDWMTVIGVVGDTKHRSATEPSQPQLYLAHYQLPMIFSSLVARTSVPPLSLASDVRRAIWSVDKDQPVWTVMALDTIVENSHGPTRFIALLLGLFAGVALLLAAVGIYGVMSYAVTERTHEIGIRMALGASGTRVRREIVGRGLALTGIALAAGIPGSITLGRVARGVLFGVQPGDPGTLVVAAVALSVVAFVACYLPARRASRVDPVIALAE